MCGVCASVRVYVCVCRERLSFSGYVKSCMHIVGLAQTACIHSYCWFSFSCSLCLLYHCLGFGWNGFCCSPPLPRCVVCFLFVCLFVYNRIEVSLPFWPAGDGKAHMDMNGAVALLADSQQTADSFADRLFSWFVKGNVISGKLLKRWVCLVVTRNENAEEKNMVNGTANK